MRRFLPLLLLTLVLGGAGLAAAAQQALRTITVTGEGEIEVAPDMATVSLAVRAEAETTGEAMDQASDATAAVLAMLADQGIDAADIRTGSIRLSPRYSSSALSSGNRIIGYSAYNSVDVTVNDLSILGDLLTASVNEGANTLNGVAFGLQDPTTAEDEARRLAVADARRRAMLYADASDVPLGDMISLNEQGTGGYHPVMAEPVMAEASLRGAQSTVPVAPGEITLRANIVVIYAIGD